MSSGLLASIARYHSTYTVLKVRRFTLGYYQSDTSEPRRTREKKAEAALWATSTIFSCTIRLIQEDSHVIMGTIVPNASIFVNYLMPNGESYAMSLCVTG